MICSRYDKNVQSLCSGLLKNEKVIILQTDTVYGFSGIIEKNGTAENALIPVIWTKNN